MKQKKTLLAVAVVLALLALTLAGCGSNTSNSTASGEVWTDNSSSTDGDFAASDTLYPESSDAVDDGGSSVSVQGEKMIYTAYLEVETTEYESSVLSLDQIVSDLGGYYENRSTSNYSTYRYADYTVRIPAAYYSDFLSQVSQACHVQSMREEQLDVGTAYYDIETRLATQRTKLERLQKLLEEADNMADIITIESAISDTELAIEQLTGSLRDYDNRIDYATVTISLREVYRLSNSDMPATTFSQRIADAFAKGCRGFVNFMEALAIFLVTAWIPVLVVVAVVIAIFVIRRRNRAGKRNVSHREDSGEKS